MTRPKVKRWYTLLIEGTARSNSKGQYWRQGVVMTAQQCEGTCNTTELYPQTGRNAGFCIMSITLHTEKSSTAGHFHICNYLNLRQRFCRCQVQCVSNGASLVFQTVKNLPMMWETQVWSLDWEDLLEKGTVTHSSILAWRILWTEEPGGL